MKPAIFSHEPEAITIRDSIDYSKKITLEMAKADTAGRPVRIYADGVFDLFHKGHANMLLQVKSFFPNVYVIAGVCGDEETHRVKGTTVFNEQERFEVVRHCRYVDEVYCHSPFTFDMDFVRKMKIDFVAHDAVPYPVTGKTNDVYQCFRDAGIFLETERSEGVSTTDVISRVLNDQDNYYTRNKGRGAVLLDREIRTVA